jgi:hypothetical protein
MIGEFFAQVGLQALYHAENDNDSSGNGYNLTNTNVGLVTGKYNNAYRKDADSDKMQRNDSLGIAYTDAFSYILWVKKNASYTSGWRVIIIEMGNVRYIGMEWSNDTTMHIYSNDGECSFTIPDDGKWHMIALTHSAAQAVKLYLDGCYMTGFTLGSTSGGGSYFTLFSQFNQTNNATRADIDEVAVFKNVELTAAFIRKWYAWCKGRLL